MKKFTYLKRVLLLASLGLFGSSYAQTWQVVQPAYTQTDVVVAGFVVDENSFTNKNDVSAEVQTMLNKLNAADGYDAENTGYGHGGGVLYFKAGHYKFRNSINLPKGVTIRGDWQKPVKGQSLDYGTVFEVYVGKNQYGANDTDNDPNQGNSFIKMHTGSCVNGITFWYPEQSYTNPVPYSHTILLGQGFGWSAEFNFVRNVTLVNSYSGIYYQDEGGTCPNVNGVYGTPLVRAVEYDHLVDVGHIDNVDISPDYWEGSGFANSPSKNNAQFRAWLKENGAGVIMRRNDWSYTCYIAVDGYNKGFYSTKSKGTDAATPNGHNYGLTFKNCKYGLYHDGQMGEGVMFTEVNVENCDYGCYVSDKAGGVLQLLKWNFANQTTDQYDLYVGSKASTKINMQESTFGSGRVVVNGGALATAGCAFNNPAPQVEVAMNGRVVLLGSTWAEAQSVSQKNIYENTIDDTALNLKATPAYTQFTDKEAKPSGTYFEVVNTPRGNRNAIPNDDATANINAALQRAKNAGGGVVYLVPGHYRINGTITIPSGVELKGSTDIGTFPLGPGSYLDIYNRNDVAVKMEANSGLRGVHFDYPEQVRCTVIPNNVIDYPFTIKGYGENIYIVNVGSRCCNRGVDMTDCNNFYINYLTGYFFREGVNVKNSRGGIVANMQCNTQVYNNGNEEKYGNFPNSYSTGCAAETDPYTYNSKNLNFLTMEDTQDILLYNNFNYNTLNGIIFKSNVSGLALGFALDDDRTGLLLDGDNINFEFINLQCVSLDRGEPSGQPKKASYITATNNYGANSTVNIFSSDWWGGSVSETGGITMENGAQGTINLYQSNFMQFGNCENAFYVNGGTLNVVNSTVTSARNNLVNQNNGGQVNIIGTFANVTGNPTTDTNNSASGTFSSQAAVSRTGWIATASYSYASNAASAIDGDNTSSWTSGWQNQNDATGSGEVWFQINMQKQNTFNQVVYDNSAAPNDGPQTYIFQVSNDGNYWETKASGNGGGNMTIIALDEPVTAQYFRIVKPASTKGNFWAIYEVNIFNMEAIEESDPTPTTLAPYGGTRRAIPGKIEAEDYDLGGEGVAYHDADTDNQGGNYRTDGVDLGNGGTGYNIGWTANGEWVKYSVTVGTTGTYTLTSHVSSQENGSGTFSIAMDDVDVTGTITAASTGWDNYTDVVTENIQLTAGDHVMTLNIGGGFNIDYMEFALVEASDDYAGTPYNGPHNVVNGFVLQAEDYDNGGEGVAYHDQYAGHENVVRGTNTASVIVYRPDEYVEIENGATGYNIGFTNNGEWLKYTLNVVEAGVYTISTSAVSGNANGGTFRISIDDTVVGDNVAVQATQGQWGNYQDYPVEGVSLTAGKHIMEWYTYGGHNIDYFTFTKTADLGEGNDDNDDPLDGYAGTPYTGTAFEIKNGAILVAENFDNGGEGVAYHDSEVGHYNNGTIQYRPTEDVEIGGDAADYSIEFTNNGEWLNYTVNVTEPGTYTIRTRVASGGDTGSYSFFIDGKAVTKTIAVPNTGGWGTWQYVDTEGVQFTAGKHLFRWYTYGGMNLNDFTFVRTGDLQENTGGGSVKTMKMHNPLFVQFDSELWEAEGLGDLYTADPSAHVFNGRLYVYASHDMQPAVGCDHMDRYHIFSTDDMETWTDHGEIFGSADVPWGRPEGGFMWAPDAAYKNGTYYYYFPHASETDWNNSWKIGVATSTDPATGYTVGGYIEGLESLIDPCVFVDEDGQAYIYHGGGGRCMGGKLKDNMIELDGTMQLMTGLDDFHEGAWVHKYNGKYYLSYADNHGTDGNQLKYAVSDSPLGPWTSKGVFLYATGCDTSHGSIVEFNGQWYAFYHTSNYSGQYNLRSVCFDPLEYDANGDIKVVENWGDAYNGPHTVAVSDDADEVLVTIEAEDFNTGYHYGYWGGAGKTGNAGNANYRTDTDIDINRADGVTYVSTAKTGEWLRYSVEVGKSALYNIRVYARGTADGAFHLSVNGTDKSGTLAVASAGFEPILIQNVPLLSTEAQYLDLRITTATSFDIDRIEIVNAAAYTGTPFNGPHDIYDGAVLEAEDFDNGGQSISYFDSTTGNDSGAYRTDVDVDIESTEDNTRTNISWPDGGEWLKYTVNVTQAGVYDIAVTMATGNGAQGSVTITIDDIYTYPSVAANTGGWGVYEDVVLSGVELTEGQHYITVTEGGNANLDKYTFTRTGDISSGVNAAQAAAGELTFSPTVSDGHYTLVAQGKTEVSVYDAVGARVFSGDLNDGDTLDLTTVASGVYVATLRCAGQAATVKLIKLNR